jgi:hypothetical protein
MDCHVAALLAMTAMRRVVSRDDGKGGMDRHGLRPRDDGNALQ